MRSNSSENTSLSKPRILYVAFGRKFCSQTLANCEFSRSLLTSIDIYWYLLTSIDTESGRGPPKKKTWWRPFLWRSVLQLANPLSPKCNDGAAIVLMRSYMLLLQNGQPLRHCTHNISQCPDPPPRRKEEKSGLHSHIFPYLYYSLCIYMILYVSLTPIHGPPLTCNILQHLATHAFLRQTKII